MANKAYKYALEQPLNWDIDCEPQLIAANDFWNKLVEIERSYIENVRAVIGKNDIVAGFEEERVSLATKFDELRIEKKRLGKAFSGETLLAEYRQRLRDLLPKLKDAKRASIAENKTRLNELRDQRFSDVKMARQNAANHGLWWGNYNAVVDSFETAAIRARKSGSELHFRRYDGEGRFTNQIQGGMSVEDLLSGTHSQVRLIEVGNDQSKKRRYHLEITAFTQGRGKRRALRFPIILHRPLPENSSIQTVAVHRRRQFDRWKWDVVFNLRIPDQAIDEPSGTVRAINFGWRATDDGIRVATIVRANGVTTSVTLPKRIRVSQEIGEQNRARMDDEINAMEGWLRTMLDTRTASQGIQDVVAKIRSAKKVRGGHFEWLRKVWETECAGWQPDELQILREFGKKWRRYKHDDTAKRQLIKNRRLYHYREEAAKLVADASLIVMNHHDMANSALRDGNELLQAARHQRVLASPSLFRDLVMQYAKDRGVPVVEDKAPHDSCACHRAPFDFTSQNRAALMWACPVTHVGLDQDVDYCRGMLKRLDAGKIAGAARKEEEVEKSPSFRPNRRRLRTEEQEATP